MITYFIFISTQTGTYNISGLTKQEVIQFLRTNETSATVPFKGKAYHLRNLFEVQIYEVKEDYNVQGYINALRTSRELDRQGNIRQSHLDEWLKNVTKDFPVDEFMRAYTGNAATKLSGESFVSKSRIEELKKVKNTNFDFTKLIKLLEELNETYKSNLVLSTAMLLRAIIDHIPPIFGMQNFDTIASQYKSPGNSRTFTAQMKILFDFKHTADRALHSHIDKTQKLPEMLQNKKQTELDVLLVEILRITTTPTP